MLPVEMWTHVFTMCDWRDLPHLNATNREFRAILKTQSIWKEIIRRFISPHCPLGSNPMQRFQKFVKGTFEFDPMTSICSERLEGHDDQIICAETFQDKVMTGALDGKAILWDLDKKTPILTLECGHWVGSLALSRSEIAIESDVICRYNTETKDYSVIESDVQQQSLLFHRNYLLSETWENTRIYDLKSGNCQHLEGIRNPISSDLASFLSRDLLPLFLDDAFHLFSFTANMIILQLDQQVSYTVCGEGKIFFGFKNGDLTSWNLQTEIFSQLGRHDDLIKCITLFEDKIITASYDHKIKIWDSVSCLATLEGHSDKIELMTLHGHKLATASYDCTVCLWDLKTRECVTAFGLRGLAKTLSFSPLGDKLLVVLKENLFIYTLQTGSIKTFAIGKTRTPVSFSGNRRLVADRHKNLIVIDNI